MIISRSELGGMKSFIASALADTQYAGTVTMGGVTFEVIPEAAPVVSTVDTPADTTGKVTGINGTPVTESGTE